MEKMTVVYIYSIDVTKCLIQYEENDNIKRKLVNENDC